MSNAPYFQALRRLRVLRIEKYFDGLLCWEGVKIPENDFSRPFLVRLKNGKYKSTIKRVFILPKSELKPNTTGYLKVLNEFKASASNCFVVGDSISKDVNPAVLIGAIGIWAKYGEKVKEKNLNTMLSITHWDKKKIDTIYVEKHKEPEFVINSFDELKAIIKSPQLELDFS